MILEILKSTKLWIKTALVLEMHGYKYCLETKFVAAGNSFSDVVKYCG